MAAVAWIATGTPNPAVVIPNLSRDLVRSRPTEKRSLDTLETAGAGAAVGVGRRP
jgi:hypothetical protein